MKAIFNIPGVVWVSLIVAVTKWLSDSFPDQPWLPAAVVILGALGKLIQVYWPKPAGEPITAQPQPAAPAALGAPQAADGDDYTYNVNQAQQQPARPRRLAAFFIG